MRVSSEFYTLAAAYLSGQKRLIDLIEGLEDIDWGEIEPEMEAPLGLLELLAIEIGEGLRSETDLRGAVLDFLGRKE